MVMVPVAWNLNILVRQFLKYLFLSLNGVPLILMGAKAVNLMKLMKITQIGGSRILLIDTTLAIVTGLFQASRFQVLSRAGQIPAGLVKLSESTFLIILKTNLHLYGKKALVDLQAIIPLQCPELIYHGYLINIMDRISLKAKHLTVTGIKMIPEIQKILF